MTIKAKTRRYLKIDDIVYQSEAFRTLPAGALKLWIDMRTQFKGSNNGNINATLSELVHRGWTSQGTLYRALPVLLERGLIARTRKGKPGPYRVCSLFRFTDLSTMPNEALFVEGKPATWDFLNWKRGEGKKIRGAETAPVLVLKQDRYRCRNRTVDPLTGAETAPVKNDEIGPKAAPVLASRGIGTHDAQLSQNSTSLYLPGGVAAVRDGDGVVLDLPPARGHRNKNSPVDKNEFDSAYRRRQTHDGRLARATAKQVAASPTT